MGIVWHTKRVGFHTFTKYSDPNTRRVMKEVILIAIGGFSLAAARAAIKSYRARKAAGDIVADAVEAGLDAIDHHDNKN